MTGYRNSVAALQIKTQKRKRQSQSQIKHCWSHRYSLCRLPNESLFSWNETHTYMLCCMLPNFKTIECFIIYNSKHWLWSSHFRKFHNIQIPGRGSTCCLFIIYFYQHFEWLKVESVVWNLQFPLHTLLCKCGSQLTYLIFRTVFWSWGEIKGRPLLGCFAECS